MLNQEKDLEDFAHYFTLGSKEGGTPAGTQPNTCKNQERDHVPRIDDASRTIRIQGIPELLQRQEPEERVCDDQQKIFMTSQNSFRKSEKEVRTNQFTFRGYCEQTSGLISAGPGYLHGSSNAPNTITA